MQRWKVRPPGSNWGDFGADDKLGGDAQFLIMGSDYPHSEGVPEPRDFLKEACTGLPEQNTRQVMYQNGKDFIAMT